ncbi:hypothetical protein KOW79_005780 [Hemibagrus wyckioides]|uniref:Uncharacterized protein n=1 Tax=Hemibagrus wyckioides TaxID=337641 RepID=A0A9D3NZ89_9TELE|nr:hypothetical protein KOW79_005780 [Hemibagrus wyckioides]
METAAAMATAARSSGSYGARIFWRPMKTHRSPLTNHIVNMETAGAPHCSASIFLAPLPLLHAPSLHPGGRESQMQRPRQMEGAEEGKEKSD